MIFKNYVSASNHAVFISETFRNHFTGQRAPSFQVYIQGGKEGKASVPCQPLKGKGLESPFNMEGRTPRADTRVKGLSPGGRLARKREQARVRMAKKRERDRRKKVEASRNILLGPPDEDEDHLSGIAPFDDVEDVEDMGETEDSVASRVARAATVRAFIESFQQQEPPTLEQEGNDPDMIQEEIIPQGDARPKPSDLEVLAKEFAMVKCTSFISDNALEKVFALVVKNYRLISHLLLSGQISRSYKHSIKPTCLKGIPPVFQCVSLHKVDEETGETVTFVRRGLTKICNQYLYAKPPFTKLICMESYVNLADVVDLHLSLHENKTTEESLLNQLKNSSLSIDGVAESKKGKRRFIITTIRFGMCIYLLRILNPLVGDDDAKQTAHDLLR